MATGLDKFKKKWGSSIERTKKEGRKAAEGHMLKEMADKKKAEESTFEKAERYIKENNIVVPEDEQYTIMSVSFFNKMEQDMRANITAELTKLNTEKDEFDMTAEQMKAIVAEVVEAMNSNRNKELALQIKLQEAQNDALRMQLELAHLAMEKHLATEGKVEEVTAVEQVEEQFEVKPKRGRRKGSVNKKKNKVKEVVVLDSGWSVPIRRGRGGYSIAWKQVIEDDRLLSTVHGVVMWAKDKGCDVADTNKFRKFHPVCQGAYIQVTKSYPGKGSWKSTLMQFGVLV